MGIVIAALAGIVFGVGLIISGMVFPAKVLGFLDLSGAWDPSLGLVMVGAVATASVGFALARRHPRSLLRGDIRLPTRQTIDLRLVVGSLLFGIGWGMAGLCPGPAVVNLGIGQAKPWVFFAALLLGMGIFQWLDAKLRMHDRDAG